MCVGNCTLLGVGICWNPAAGAGRLHGDDIRSKNKCNEKPKAYTAGATVAFAAVERLIFLACSRTLDLASSMAVVEAAVDLHRTKAVAFGVPGTRTRAAGIAMVSFVDHRRPGL